LVGLMLISLLALFAQPARAADEDPPGRVGRLSEVEGAVWVYAPESAEWIAAARNRPVTTGDRLSTEKDGRAEIRIGSTTLRIAANTELEVLQLDDNHLSLQLLSGSLSARLRTRESANEFGVATGEGRFRTDRTGSYRFDRIDDTSQVTVVSGQAQFEGDRTAPSSGATSPRRRRSTASPTRCATRSPTGWPRSTSARSAASRHATCRPR